MKHIQGADVLVNNLVNNVAMHMITLSRRQ